jgi:hypothetical protein
MGKKFIVVSLINIAKTNVATNVKDSNYPPSLKQKHYVEIRRSPNIMETKPKKVDECGLIIT